jgi:AraC family transcriptional regulator
MMLQPTLRVNYNEPTATLQVTPRPPQLSSHQAGWPHLGIQHHIQPAIQTPTFQPLQHLLVIHLRAEVGIERNLGGSFQRGNNLPGEITIIPAHCDYKLTTTQESEILLLSLNPDWVSQLAYETIGLSRLEIMPHFPQSDPLIHGIGLTLHRELQSDGCGDRFYIESLSNTLSIHLLKRYALQEHTILDLQGGLPRYTTEST